MKLFGLEIRRATKKGISQATAPTSAGIHLASREYPMLLSTVYRCVDLISDSVGVLPLETYQVDAQGYRHPAYDTPFYDLLNLEPNADMSRFVFFKTMAASVLLTGNAFAYIVRDASLRPRELVYIPTERVMLQYIVAADGTQHKRFRVQGFTSLAEPRDMIHIMNFSYNGQWGVSTLTHARQTLQIASSSEEHALGYFKSGAATTGVLNVEGPRLSKEQKKQIYETWSERVNPVTGTPNGIVVLEGNMKYQPITLSPRDSQLLESRLFNVQDICRFFSVSPVKAFDLSRSSYSTIEATQLEYLTDTALPMLTKIELEINRKLFLPSQRRHYTAAFDTSAILRSDLASQSAYLNTLFNIGALTPNEARRRANLPPVQGGDGTFIQVNVQALEAAGKKTEQTPEP